MRKTADSLAAKLTPQPPIVTTEQRSTHAAVATIVCEIDARPHLLFIQRSESPHDPWSGHLAFPGGRIDPEDANLRVTAERETLEEIGLDISTACYLGCLPAKPTINQRVHIATFVYTMDAAPKLTLDPVEVADTHWIPVAHLLDHGRKTKHEHEGVAYPAVDILGQTPMLWGLTLRICEELFQPR